MAAERNPSKNQTRKAIVLDFAQPYQTLREFEPFRPSQGPDGKNSQTRCVSVNTVFLTATACPIGCRMCDLHEMTLPGPTPDGAILAQIEAAEQTLGESSWIKLYNSGNFFDPNSIPRDELAGIAHLCDRYERVIVENHPSFGQSRHLVWRDALSGRLEIAVGLETVQPRWLKRMDKKMSRDDFDRYASFLQRHDIDLRVFLIVGVPGIRVAEAFRWARLSVRHATRQGARHISLIPCRTGNGWGLSKEQCEAKLPTFTIRELAELYDAVLEDTDGRACVSIDPWGLPSESSRESDSSHEPAKILERLSEAILLQDKVCP